MIRSMNRFNISPQITFKHLLLLSTLVLIFTSAHAHSLLMNPHPYGNGCKGCAACPPYIRWTASRMDSSWRNATNWRRGETVNIQWEKNNHNGGFVRLSLVPLSQMFNRSAHSYLAFYFTCWEHGAYICKSSICGSDLEGRAFSRSIIVPPVIPDGDYVLGFLWFGGLHWRRDIGRFSDYTSCARVRVEGGMPITEKYVPYFYPGQGGESKRYGRCLTSASAPGECTHGCTHATAEYSIPKQFSSGMEIHSLTPADFAGRRANFSSPQYTKPKEYGSDHGICTGDVCCSSSCNACIQKSCKYRTGGPTLCCPKQIRSNRRECGTVGAPCRLK